MMRGPGPQSEHAGLKSEHAAASEVGVHSGMAHSGTATLASITSSVATAIHRTLSANLATTAPNCASNRSLSNACAIRGPQHRLSFYVP